MNKIKLSKFDILGFLDLEDNKDIESLTTPLSNGLYLSRNMSYYNLKTCKDCSELREKCKQILLKDLTNEKKFVVYEYMLNCSAKVFYNELKKKISKLKNDYENSKLCFEEDCYNLICVMTGNLPETTNNKLIESEEEVEDRQIELDNKALLALFCSNIDINKNCNVVLTGLGGIYLGPFCKILHGSDYSIAPLSAYAGAKDLLDNNSLRLRDYLSEPQILDQNKEIVFLDDNIGTGNTMKKLKSLLQSEGKSCRCGAVQYNWINYYKVETGEKVIDRFKPFEIDFLNKFNYPGIKLLKHAVFEHLETSGDDYVEYIKSKSYRHADLSDLETLAKRGEKYANLSGVYFDSNSKVSCKEKQVNHNSLQLIGNIDKAFRQNQLQND